jgi:hypothetical protein
MLAVDTNVVRCLLVKDDIEQGDRPERCSQLRRGSWPRRLLLGSGNSSECKTSDCEIRQALLSRWIWYTASLDFADSLYLALLV